MKESWFARRTQGPLFLAVSLVGLALVVVLLRSPVLLSDATVAPGVAVTMLVQASLPDRSDVLACLQRLDISSVPAETEPGSVLVEINAEQRTALEACGVTFNRVRPFVLIEGRSPASLNLASAYAENATKVPFSTFSVQSAVRVSGAPAAAMVASADLYYKLQIKPGVPWNGVDAALQSSNKSSYDWICGRHHPTTTCFVEWNATNRDWLNGTLVNGDYTITIDSPSDLTSDSYLDFWSLRLYYNEPTPTPTPKVGDFRAMLPILMLRVD
jgi:hypothetical protein